MCRLNSRNEKLNISVLSAYYSSICRAVKHLENSAPIQITFTPAQIFLETSVQEKFSFTPSTAQLEYLTFTPFSFNPIGGIA